MGARSCSSTSRPHSPPHTLGGSLRAFVGQWGVNYQEASGRKLLKALPQFKTKKQLCSQGAPFQGRPGPTWGVGGGQSCSLRTPQGFSMTPSPRAGQGQGWRLLSKRLPALPRKVTQRQEDRNRSPHHSLYGLSFLNTWETQVYPQVALLPKSTFEDRHPWGTVNSQGQKSCKRWWSGRRN